MRELKYLVIVLYYQYIIYELCSMPKWVYIMRRVLSVLKAVKYEAFSYAYSMLAAQYLSRRTQ